MLLIPYQTFTIVDIVEETITSLSGKPLTLQTFKLYSELSTALKLFDTVSRHFPPSSLTVAVDETFNVESEERKVYQLSGEQLKNFQPLKIETPFVLQETLPEYHILGTCTITTKIQTPALVGLLKVSLLEISVVHAVLNISVLEEAIRSDRPVYLRLAFKYSHGTATETNPAMAAPTTGIQLVPKAGVQQILQVCKRESEKTVENHDTKPTTYIISSNQNLDETKENEQQIVEFFPLAARSRVDIRHVASEHFTALFLRDNVLVFVMLARCPPFTFRFALPFTELQSSVRKYMGFVSVYLVILLFMSIFSSDDLYDQFSFFSIPLALYSFVWIWEHVIPNDVPQD